MRKFSAIAIGAVVLVVLMIGVAIWYVPRYLAGRDLARWQALAAKKENGATLLAEIQKRQAELSDDTRENDAVAYAFMGVSLGNLGDTEGAVQYYKKALRVDSQNRTALNNIAVAYQDMGNWTEAERYYRQLIATYPTYTPGYRSLGYLYQHRLGNSEEQIRELFEQGLLATDDHPDLLSWIASYYQETGKPEMAVPYAQRLTQKLNEPVAPSPVDVKIE